MKAALSVVVTLLSMSLFLDAALAKRPKAPGERVKSGAFYDFVTNYYSKTLPPLIEAKDAEKYYATAPIDKARFKLKDEDGKVWDYESRKARTKERWSENPAEWDVKFKIKKVTMTDATHGAVEYLLINDWENTFSGAEGRFQVYTVSYWENIDGEWRMVYAERGTPRRYRY